ncbi:MAG: Kae1-associated serine/threonine protein kinase [Candidatus Lokiarchaeota archaeon]|nr:Kae1-associated serine/threonine protein kinase [Candidatus Lokiarchaeota archaeon]
MNSEIYKEKLIHKGAEASLYLGKWFDKKVIFKHRIPKKYRIEEIDNKIRLERTLNEGRALIRVKNYGINVPQVYEIDPQNAIIIMRYIEGEKLKNLIETLNITKMEKIFNEIGIMVAILHKNGHIHGDITTSNLLVTNEENIFLIDFGLHEYSDTIEDKSVDLHLFKRVLISSHGSNYEFCFNAFLEGYRSEYEKLDFNECKSIIKNVNAIETRGRYVKSEDRK